MIRLYDLLSEIFIEIKSAEEKRYLRTEGFLSLPDRLRVMMTGSRCPELDVDWVCTRSSLRAFMLSNMRIQ